MQKRVLRIVLGSMSLLVPLTVQSASALRITDGIAGIGTELLASGLDARERVLLVLRSPAEEEDLLRLTADTTGTIRTFLPGNLLESAGTYTATLENGRGSSLANTRFTIDPEDIDAHASSVEVRHGEIAADGEDAADVIVTLRDHFGNPIAGRPVDLIGGTGSEEITPLGGETDSGGEQRFLVRTHVEGLRTVRAIDLLSGEVLEDIGEIVAGGTLPPMGGHRTSRYGAQLVEGGYEPGQTSAFQELPADEIDRFVVTVDPVELRVNEVARSVLIQAVDRNGRVVRDYTGTVRIQSPTDPGASLPGLDQGIGQATFTPRERGEKNLRLIVSFSKAGEQVLRIEDRANSVSPITGEVKVRVKGAGGGDETTATIVISSHKNGDALGNRTFTLVGTADPFVNLIVMVNGIDSARSDTDQNGNFQIPITLDPSIQNSFTLRVQDESRRQDSGPITLSIDTSGPEIKTISIVPEKPEEGSEMLIIVISEPTLSKVTAVINKETITLTENAKEPGTYQGLSKAPPPGSYQPVITVVDSAGNSTDIRGTLTSVAKGLPQVQNVRVQARANAAELTWDPVKAESVKAYRIYVGEQEDDFLYTLDTDRAAVSATVAGLRPATRYYFAVTALSGDRESAEKSQITQAVILGTKLAVTEDDDALYLEWTFPEGTPLASFLLEYGDEKESYTEKRILNSALRNFALRDVLRGIRYYLRLTPVATTGDLLSDLAALGEGTPSGTGYHFAAPDDIPFPIDNPDMTIPPSNDLHENTPETFHAGLPPVALWTGLGITAVALLLEWNRRRTLRLTIEFMRNAENRYRQ